MSERRIPTSDDRAASLLKSLSDRIYRLENGGALRGLVSFDSTVQIGDVRISVVNTGGLNRNVVFQEVDAAGNPVVGHSYTITL